jgi:hypothetical protein
MAAIDIGLFELNEAFAAVVLLYLRDLFAQARALARPPRQVCRRSQ